MSKNENKKNQKQVNSTPAANTLSYSSVAKKVFNKTVEDEKVSDHKVYKTIEFNAMYSPDFQVKIGPIPGKIEYREAYGPMKRFFRTIGDVQNQYLEPETHLEGKKEVRYGIVVFKRKKDAAAVLDTRFMMLGNNKIKLYKH